MSAIGQWAQCTITAVAANTATLSITAASKSGNNVTYTYTVTQGSVTDVISGGALYVIITGMADSGNNGHFVATTFGTGTFTVANASGVTRGSQTGTGTCPSDSAVGPAVFCSANNLSGYYFIAGPNTYSGDGRLGCHEMWKMVSGVGTALGFTNGVGATAPSVNDILAISVAKLGTIQTVTAWLNGGIMTNALSGGTPTGAWSVVDSDLASGSQGIETFSVGGPNEYLWTKWNASGGAGLVATTPGNAGTKATYAAGDIVETALASDAFTYTNGDLHTKNANWVYAAGTFTVSSHKVYCSSAAIAGAYRSDLSPKADQYSEVVAVIAGAGATQNTGPAVRVSSSANSYYCIQYASDVFQISKMIAGTFTAALVTSADFPVNGDTIRLCVTGTTLLAFKNGVYIMSVTDTALLSGNVGLFGAGNATTNGFSSWAGGDYEWNQTITPTFSGATLGASWTGPVANNSETTPNLTGASIAVSSGNFTPALNYAGVAQAFWTGAAAPFIASPTPCVLTDSNGNVYTTASLGGTAGAFIGNPIPICMTNDAGNVYTQSFSTGGGTTERPTPVIPCDTNGNAYTATGSLSGVFLGHPTAVAATDVNGRIYTETDTITVQEGSPTPIVLTDATGHVLTFSGVHPLLALL